MTTATWKLAVIVFVSYLAALVTRDYNYTFQQLFEGLHYTSCYHLASNPFFDCWWLNASSLSTDVTECGGTCMPECNYMRAVPEVCRRVVCAALITLVLSLWLFTDLYNG